MKFVRNGKLNIFGGFVYFFNKAERAGKIGGKFKKGILSIYFTKTLGMDIAVNRDAV